MNIVKARAAQACIDRFSGSAYRPGTGDCVRLIRHHLRGVGVSVPCLKGRSWTNELTGLRLMRKLGYPDLVAAVDDLGLPRIAPARAVVGDILALPTDGGPWGCALAIAVGNGRAFGFSEGRAQLVQPLEYVAAWRV
ncbi:MAG: DUF6950 family protein [Brevundimonas sp.]|uniref:DUF6950 family protein n=1 Tax=Brevundimonas sp. TaxID=1871086 RepID=UPI00403323AE